MGHRAAHPDCVESRAASASRSAVSGAAPSGTARVDPRRMGRFGKQPPGEILCVDEGRTEISAKRTGELGTFIVGNWPGFRRSAKLGGFHALACGNFAAYAFLIPSASSG